MTPKELQELTDKLRKIAGLLTSSLDSIDEQPTAIEDARNIRLAAYRLGQLEAELTCRFALEYIEQRDRAKAREREGQ